MELVVKVVYGNLALVSLLMAVDFSLRLEMATRIRITVSSPFCLDLQRFRRKKALCYRSVANFLLGVPASGRSGCQTLGESVVNLAIDTSTGKLSTQDYFQPYDYENMDGGD